MKSHILREPKLDDHQLDDGVGAEADGVRPQVSGRQEPETAVSKAGLGPLDADETQQDGWIWGMLWETHATSP